MSATRERIFSDHFIQIQEQLFRKASEAYNLGESLLAEDKIRPILEYMKDLHIDQGGRFSGDIDKGRDFSGLLILINSTSNTLKEKNKSHPLITPLEKVNNNICDMMQLSYPDAFKELDANEEKSDRVKSNAKCNIVKDTCGILACLLWTAPEKIVTCCNGLECCCGKQGACCPEIDLPIQHSDRKQYVHFWSPVNSINALCEDIRDQCEIIDRENAAPIKQAMR